MLCIKRHVGEKVMLLVDGQVVGEICLVETGGNHARLGLNLHPNIEIVREELLATWRGRDERDIIPIQDQPPVA
jgi:sRNA-binding carbon storage regulator CsrA